MVHDMQSVVGGAAAIGGGLIAMAVPDASHVGLITSFLGLVLACNPLIRTLFEVTVLRRRIDEQAAENERLRGQLRDLRDDLETARRHRIIVTGEGE